MKAALISLRGKTESVFLEYPAKGKRNYRRDNLAPISFEAQDGEWYALPSEGTVFVGREQRGMNRIRLSGQTIVPMAGTADNYLLYVEEVNRRSIVHHNYELRSGKSV